jgi:hypothetical protein
MTPDPEPGISPDGGSEPTGSTVESEVTVRRIPRYSRFLILGAGLGAVVTFILTASFPSDPKFGFGALFGFFLIFGVPLGVLLGAVLAIVLDAGLRRRARKVMAEHTTVDPRPYDDELSDGGAADAPESPGETDTR